MYCLSMTRQTKRRRNFLGVGLIAMAFAAGLLVYNAAQTDGENGVFGLGSGGDLAKTSFEPGLDGIQQTGELVVLTVDSPTTFDLRGDMITGYEVDLTQALADDLGVDVTYQVFDDIPSLITAIENGEGHLAAPGLTQREIRLDKEPGASLIYGPAYKTVQPQMVCRRDGPRPDGLEDTTDVDIGVLAGSGNEETLENISLERPDFEFQRVNAGSGLTLAREVHDKSLDCAVIDSNIVSIARPLYPELVTTRLIGKDDRQIAWALPPGSEEFNTYLTDWFAAAHQDGFLHDLDEEYYGYVDDFDYVDISVFRKRIDTRLPKFEDHFRTAAGDTGLDWTMLAAQGYQESHWDPTAKSPTGVRGLMMLTRPTAKEVGVANRLDPTESIRGGAKYLDRLYDRLPDSVTGYDRLWLAMAAYNVGYGHLLDARRLARREGLDPDKWRVVKSMLPRLTQKKYYSTVKYGYARGYEPVRYVSRIREYDQVLTNRVPEPEKPPFRPATEEDFAQAEETVSAGTP